MGRKLICAVIAALTLQIVGAAQLMCPSDPNCVCGGTLAVELNCNIDGHMVKINLLPNIYINIKCENATNIDYNKLPKCANHMNFRSVSFKDCPLPPSSFKNVLTNMGVSKTMALIFQNAKNLSGYFDRKHFAGLHNLTKLLLSINGVTHLPDNLFVDINKLTWLNIRSNSINLSEELFKPLERLETLEISHNHMTNISSNLFSHLSFLRKLSLWQSNVTWFSKDLFSGVDVLEELDLSSNGLNELPASIFKPLKKLKKLTLFSNKFSSLPQNLFRNNNELEIVVILNNDVKLKELPKYMFANLANLKEIYIQRSGLEDIPYDVFVNSSLITNISLAYNDIKTLPEPIFNDQINLLELDLSNNKLTQLDPKIFSSLVRLEQLNLCHNSLVQISGSTFSSLLSLIYLNMEHNNLKTITSYLFRNNKQKMSISLAYNRLNFEEIEMKNNDCIIKTFSPFAHTYNLKLLNLSHNAFTRTFKDWWINGHENLDISYNYISKLWEEKEVDNKFQHLIKKPVKNVWISRNPMCCACENYYFMDMIEENPKNKIADLELLWCPNLAREVCYPRLLILVIIGSIIASFYILFLIIYIILRKEINEFIKEKICDFLSNPFGKADDNINMVIRYSENDEEFVQKEIMPMVRHQTGLSVQTKAIKSSNNANNFMNNITSCVKDDCKNTTVVIFSPNYLTSIYSHVDIKKIHSEMLKAENTIYVFVDIGPENSIYTFLKDQRDNNTTLVWSEPKFWQTFFEILIELNTNMESLSKNEELLTTKTAKGKLTSDSSSGLPEWPTSNNFNTPTHSLV